MALHNLTNDFLAVQSLDVDESAIADTLQQIQMSFEEKAENIIRVYQNVEGDIDSLDKEIARLSDRKKALQNKNDRFIDYLRENMEKTGITKISCQFFSITLVEGQDVVAVEDESAIPDEFVKVKTTITPDKIAIKKALKDGLDVSGCKLKTGKSSIRIK